MTEELREKLDDILTRYGNYASGYDADGDELDIDEALAEIEKVCRKLPKPPLLSDEEMGKVKFDMGSPWGVGDRYTVGRAIAQAQRNSDIKWYEG